MLPVLSSVCSAANRTLKKFPCFSIKGAAAMASKLLWEADGAETEIESTAVPGNFQQQ